MEISPTTPLRAAGFLFPSTSTTEPVESLSQRQTAAILEDFRQEFYPVHHSIFTFVSRLGAATYELGLLEDDEIRQTVTEDNPIFVKQVKDIQRKLLAKHGVPNEASFSHSCELLHAQDQEVATLLRCLREDFETALSGNLPTGDCIQVPPEFSQTAVLEVLRHASTKSIIAIADRIEQLLLKGETISLQNPAVMQAIQDNSPETWMEKQLTETILGKVASHPLASLLKAIQAYEKDEGFCQEAQRINEESSILMNAFYEESITLESLAAFKQSFQNK